MDGESPMREKLCVIRARLSASDHSLTKMNVQPPEIYQKDIRRAVEILQDGGCTGVYRRVVPIEL